MPDTPKPDIYRHRTKAMIWKTYGLLTVQAIEKVPGRRGVYVRCLCKCGRETVVIAINVRRGNTKSCGCAHWKTGQEHHNFKNGGRNDPTYHTWSQMKKRCYNPNSDHYKDYGGRGIIVCQAWKNSFAVFLKDMGRRPAGMEIDRIDNNGPYCPFNCRWADRVTQANNTRSNRILVYGCKAMTVTQWERSVGLPVGCVRQRIKKLGWSIERAINTPSRLAK